MRWRVGPSEKIPPQGGDRTQPPKRLGFLLKGGGRIVSRIVIVILIYHRHKPLDQGWPTQMILRATLEMHHNSAGHI
jgi:hypothetical protein